MNKQKQAFTLVELIVVITILAILATIAFISFQWFARDARNSARMSDLKVIQKALQVYEVKESRYPDPTNTTWITYSWSEVWIQWTFWNDTRAELWTIWQEIVDPLTKSEYTYSLLNTKREYQLWAVLEWTAITYNTNLTNQANASWEESAYAYVVWDYNWLLAKSWNCMLSVPSIIASDTSDTDLATIIANKKLIYKWYRNLPSSYSWTTFNTNWEWNLVLTNQIEAYCWDFSQLSSSGETERLTMLTNLQTAYSWTTIQNNSEQISELLTAVTPEEKRSLAAAYVNDNFGTNIKVETWPVDWTASIACSWKTSGEVIYEDWTVDWSTLTCDQDIAVCSWDWIWYVIQACNLGATSTDVNSTDSYWKCFQWGNNAFLDWNSAITTTRVYTTWKWPWNYYNSPIFIKTGGGSSTRNWSLNNNNNLWWYSDYINWWSIDKTLLQWPCPDWYHVPTNTEWTNLVVDWWWEASNNWTLMRSKIKLPYAGRRRRSSWAVFEKGQRGSYWTSRPRYTWEAYIFRFTSNYVVPSAGSLRSAMGHSVRCFKN